MKYLKYYEKQKIVKENVFINLIESLRSSIKVWEYFVNWTKVNSNLEEVKIELNILNSLIGSTNIEKDFIDLIIKYPAAVKTLPILLAVRDNKLEILKDYKKKNLDYLNFDFNEREKISTEEAKKYFTYIQKSGLINLFENKKVKNFVDYVIGVEVGLDSNGRKNRGGTLMEEIVEVFVKEACERNNDLDYMPQARPKKIKEIWGYDVSFDKTARSYDFAIFNKKSNKLFLIETNFYNGGGSKLKSVCGEFKSLFNELQEQNIELIWVTDGRGWITAKRPLEETFKNNNHVFNLQMLQEEILDEVLIGN
jgi:hypothetical protein